MKIKFISISLLLIAVILIGSCSKSSNVMMIPVTSTYTATLSGANETPPNASTATGSATFTYNPTTFILSGSVSFSGFTTATTEAHIHMGAVGVAGNVIFTIEATGPFTSPISYTSPALTTSQAADLAAGNYYVNIHTTAFPDGEIRGQLLLQGGSGGNGGGGGGGGGGGY